jgi:Ca2+-transporting ATPase
MGKSDAIKKLLCEECVTLEESREIGNHTDCFVVSGSKVLEGVGSYVVIAWGRRALMGGL